MKKAILISFVVILGTAVALQAEFQVNTYISDNQEHPDIAMDTAGNFVVVWESKGQDGSGDGVYGRRFDAAGMALGSEFQINTTIGGYQDDPDVAMDAEGNFVVVWEGDDGEDEGVYARLYSANGQPRTDEFLVNSFTTSRQKEPRVAMNESGAFVIVWEWSEPLPAYHVHWHVMGRLYDAAGVPQGTDFEIDQLPHGHVPDVAMDESGDFVVAWERDGDGDNPPLGHYVRCRMYNADGTPKGNAVQITGGNYTYFSSIATNSSGSFVITWSYHPDPSQRDVYAQRFDPDGNTITGPYMVNTYTTDRQSRSSAAMHDSGELVVVWYSEGQDGSSHGVFGQRYNSVSMPVDEEFQLNTYTLAEQWYPDIALSESGRFVVVWQSQGQDGSGYGIFAEFGQLPRQLTYYVDRDAAGANNGSSWADAFNDLQDALAVALPGDEIRVAEGIYKPIAYMPPPPPPPLGSSNVEESVEPAADRTATFQLKNSVVIKGGYAGFGGPDLNERDPNIYETVLSGDIGIEGNNSDNSYHVVTGSGCDETAVLDGFTITAGHANGSNPEDRGAGMTNDSGGPTLTNCTFVRNWAHYAAGIANKNGSNPTLTNCTFRDNLVVASGGAVYNWNHSNSTLTNCTFSGNSAPDGAAMFIYNSRPTLTNCLFGGNSSQYNGSALYLRLSSPTLTNCTFSGNSAGGDGGGMYNEDSSPTVTNCTFSKNSAAFGGGICNWLGSPTLVNCEFTANSADCGGGLWNDNCNAMLSNCLFSGNSAVRHGGGICRAGGSRSPTLANCTFSANSAGKNGGGICNWDTGDKATLYNCILWGNTDQSGMNEESQIDFGILDYCCVQGWTGNLGGTGNIDADPCFVEPDYIGPIAYWKLDEAGGTTAYDSVDDNHGTLINNPAWTTGQVAGALSFDGMNDYVDVGNDSSLMTTGDLTISAWIKANKNRACIYSHTWAGWRLGFGIGNNNYDGRLGFYTSSHGHWIEAGNSLADDTWHHVAVTLEGNMVRLYTDGFEIGRGIGAPASNLTRNANIGIYNYTWHFGGIIDEVAIYKRALSADEIQQHYLSGLNGQAYPDANTPDYHLLPGSPCINSGDPDYIAEPNETDLDGKPRVIGGRIDMGAYEFNHIPVADAGQDRTVEAQAPWGATVTLDGSGSSDADSTPGTFDDINDFNWYQLDPCDPNADIFLGSGRIIDCNLPIGEHIILLEVIDKVGASDTNEVTIIVQDTTPPVFTSIPQDVTVECDGNGNVAELNAWLASAAAVDECGDVTITNDFVGLLNGCGATGSATVTWTAEDESGNTATATATFTIVDTTPPEFEFSVEPNVLWPPNHRMVEIGLSGTAGDGCDASPLVSLVSITMNESHEAIGDGHTPDDIQISDDGSLYLRAERSALGEARIYTITCQAVDACGNSTVRTATVTVPHDLSSDLAPGHKPARRFRWRILEGILR